MVSERGRAFPTTVRAIVVSPQARNDRLFSIICMKAARRYYRHGATSLPGQDRLCILALESSSLRKRTADGTRQGRSAFEPTQSATQSIDYLQLDASESELPRAYQEAGPNNYIQLYDERGNPINPRSHDSGKKLRDAQNDVLASVGVVERRRAPSTSLPGSYEERLELLEAEDTVGNAIAFTTILTEDLYIWWIGTIRDRILVQCNCFFHK